jgi:signal transduction histidine kinase
MTVPRPGRREWYVAVALLALALAEVAADPARDDRIPIALIAVPATLGLAWRKVAPVQLFAVVAIVYHGALLAGVEVVEVLTLGGAVTGVCAYSMGMYAHGWADRWGLLVVWGGISMVAFTQTPEVVGDAIVPPIIFGVLPWLAGRTMRRRRRLTAALEETARQLEAEREDRARAAVLDERVRIARELHDLVAHSVSTMVVQAGAARRSVRAQPDDARAAALTIETTGREALGELRGLLGVLRRGDEELALAPQPTLERVDALVDGARAAGLDVGLRVEGAPAPLPRGQELAAYRIVQESLTNALQHAGGARTDVVVRYGRTALEIEVADDGAEPGGGSGASGHGLVGMRERVALYGGSFDAGPGDDGGWVVRARLPRSEAAA